MPLVPIAAPPPPAPPPTRALVFATEHRFSASRRAGRFGRVIIQLRNVGEDDHDLAVRGPRGRVLGSTGIVHPGRLGEVRLRLLVGRYTLFCSISDHEALGMRSVLTLRRPARGRR